MTDLVCLVQELDNVKKHLLQAYYPDIPKEHVHSGYHRGHRPMVGTLGLPDIISVHHLHLHVIVYPFSILKMFKYPNWLSLMWANDEEILQRAVTHKSV